MITPEEAERLKRCRVQPDTLFEGVLDILTPPLLGALGCVALDMLFNSRFDSLAAAIYGGGGGMIYHSLREHGETS